MYRESYSDFVSVVQSHGSREDPSRFVAWICSDHGPGISGSSGYVERETKRKLARSHGTEGAGYIQDVGLPHVGADDLDRHANRRENCVRGCSSARLSVANNGSVDALTRGQDEAQPGRRPGNVLRGQPSFVGLIGRNPACKLSANSWSGGPLLKECGWPLNDRQRYFIEGEFSNLL